MQRIKQVSRAQTLFGTLLHVSERWSYKHLYEGLQVNICHSYKIKTKFLVRDTIVKNGNIRKFIGSQDDIFDNNLNVKVRLISSLSGRDKQVKNKVCKGELRRKRVENQMLSFGLSESKKYHKAKHSK